MHVNLYACNNNYLKNGDIILKENRDGFRGRKGKGEVIGVFEGRKGKGDEI